MVCHSHTVSNFYLNNINTIFNTVSIWKSSQSFQGTLYCYVEIVIYNLDIPCIKTQLYPWNTVLSDHTCSCTVTAFLKANEWSTSLVLKKQLTLTFRLACPWLWPLVLSHAIRSTQHMCCWTVQSGLRIVNLFPVSFALPEEHLVSGVPFALGRGWVLGITGVRLKPEQPKAANPLSLLILFLSASSPCHHAALSGFKGQHRQKSHVTQHQTKTIQNPSSAEH